MSSESKKMKSKIDLELVLNYTNQNVRKKLKNDWCAGANAASRIDSAFSETDPLSEIVWSPDKGFSLKCVDSSFTNKKSSLFRDVEPSSMVLALLQSVASGSSTTEKPVDDVFVEPIAVICTKSEVSSTDTPSRNPTSDSVIIVSDHETCEENDTGKKSLIQLSSLPFCLVDLLSLFFLEIIFTQSYRIMNWQDLVIIRRKRPLQEEQLIHQMARMRI